MALLVNNQDLNKHFRTIIGYEDIAINTVLSVNYLQDEMHTLSGNFYMKTAEPIVMLQIELYLNQAQSQLDREFNFHKVETRISTAIRVMDGRFIQRTMEPFRDGDPMIVNYTIRLADHEKSLYNLHQYALTQVDQEFAAILESTLSED